MSSAAILFAENRYRKQISLFLKKNILFPDFLSEVEKPSAEISEENKKWRITTKIRKTGSTDCIDAGSHKTQGSQYSSSGAFATADH